MPLKAAVVLRTSTPLKTWNVALVEESVLQEQCYFGNDLTLHGSLRGPLRPRAFIGGLLIEHTVG